MIVNPCVCLFGRHLVKSALLSCVSEDVFPSLSPYSAMLKRCGSHCCHQPVAGSKCVAALALEKLGAHWWEPHADVEVLLNTIFTPAAIDLRYVPEDLT